MTDKKKTKTGPPPQTVKIDKQWEDAIGDALKKKRPVEGWPEATPPKPKTKKPA
ncbi:MAG TPA: hypothetical protein VGH80_14325 [Xanthomonadaceae bacterium]|jgi:hypothetical protein